MNEWNKLLAQLDALFSFPHKVASTASKVRQDFDNDTQEHIVTIEYRVRIDDTRTSKRDRSRVTPTVNGRMVLMRELMLHDDDSRS